MMKNNLKWGNLLIVCFTVIFALVLIGCTEKGGLDNLSSDISGAVSGGKENVVNDGIELPDVEFDLSEQTENNQSNNTSQEDYSETSSVTQEDENGETSSSHDTLEKETSSSDQSGEDTSYEDTGLPSENEDGGIELPMDEW